MKVPSHLIGLYYKSVRKYRKLTSRLNRQKKSSPYQYHVLLDQLKKLRKKIEELQFQLKIATASAVLILGLGLTDSNAQTNSGPFALQPRHLNPLAQPFYFEGTTYPAIVDLDKDGDFDLVVGEDNKYSYYDSYYDRPLRYLVNIGSNSAPVYEEKSGEDNPFDQLPILGSERGPVFADIDKDNDDDLFVGLNDGAIQYFRNDDGVFTEQTGVWNPATKEGNPLGEINFGTPTKIFFVDLDNDADLDVFIGANYTSYIPDPPYYEEKSIQYYKNDGDGNFSEANAEITLSPMPTGYIIAPTLADLDADGDVDLVIGGYYADLRFYRQITPGQFVEETGPWDVGTKTGNPFDEISFTNTQPVFVDLDNDGDPDLLLGEGDGDHSYGYPANIIHYYENTGNNVFTERTENENPVGGFDVGHDASPVLIDIDGDNDLDALIGNKYDNFVSYSSINSPVYVRNDNGVFKQIEGAQNPFESIETNGIFYHDVADVDGDGDLDLIAGDHYGNVNFFRNDAGIYTEEIALSPFAGIDVGSQSSPKLFDLDNDQDPDLVISNNLDIYYFENTGTAQNPQYEERLDTENPFSVIETYAHIPFVQLADLDHDGDLDVLASNYIYTYSNDYRNRIVYYENIGTASVPDFELSAKQPFEAIEISREDTDSNLLQPYLTDFDADGDLDVFIGDNFGVTNFVKNENPPVFVSVTATELTYEPGDDPLIIEPNLILTDADDDLIVQAKVVITDFQMGELLTFVPQTGITGSFNESSGVLTFQGKAMRPAYESLLRTVAFEFNEEQPGRKRDPKKSVITKSITFQVFDTDFTNPVVASKVLNILINEPPTINAQTLDIASGSSATVDLKLLIADPNGLGDLDMSSLRIVQQPASGVQGTIDSNGILTVNYNSLSFSGPDELVIEVCDLKGECTQSIITINVTSTEIVVYNALAPNSSGDNKFMRITGLPESNKINIYNRWGDKVYDAETYLNAPNGNAFKGLNNNGNSLPSGTYYYTIEIPGKKMITGYLTLKQ